MHPAFYVVDHRIGLQDPVPYETKAITRRSKPKPLRLSLPPPGTPLVTYTPVKRPAATVSPTLRGTWLARLLTRLRHAPAT